MSHKSCGQSRQRLLRALSAVLLSGVVAGCSSDVTRFSYYEALRGVETTASVDTPFSGDLQPVGVGTQAYPGDYRAPSGSYQSGTVGQARPNYGYGEPTYGAYSQASRSYSQTYPQAYPGSLAPSSVTTASISGASGAKPVAPTTGQLASTATRSSGTQYPQSEREVARVPNFIDRVNRILGRKSPAVGSQDKAIAASAPSRSPIIHPKSLQTDNITTASVKPASLTPDPIVTGSIPPSQIQPGRWTIEGGTKVVVNPGDTAYSLSQRFGVPSHEIMKVNQIADSRHIRAGQVLTIPTFHSSQTHGLAASAQAELKPTSVIKAASATPAPVVLSRDSSPANLNVGNRTAVQTISTGNPYTVVAGDSLSKIANNFGVSVAQLKTVNNITGSQIQIGQKILIPSQAGTLLNSSPKADHANVQSTSIQPQPSVVVREEVTQPILPKSKNASVNVSTSNKVDTINTASIDVTTQTPEKTGIGKLRWPARGQITTSFGSPIGNKTNDGIIMSLPVGSEIKAAENGVVIYADNGLKGYGNTVLIRHDGDLVTVYAHADSLKVVRGDKVSRGQVIALSGMTGSAKRPQLHFEVREKATPRNPITYLE